MINGIEFKKLTCPICKKGLGTIEIHGAKGDNSEVDFLCTRCHIWVNVKKVTDQEKLELFEW